MSKKLKALHKRYDEEGTILVKDTQFVKEYATEFKEWVQEFVGKPVKWTYPSPKIYVSKFLHLLCRLQSIDPTIASTYVDILQMVVMPGNDPQIRYQGVCASYNVISLMYEFMIGMYWIDNIFVFIFSRDPVKYAERVLGIGELRAPTGDDMIEYANVIIKELNPELPEHFQFWWSMLSKCFIPHVFKSNISGNPKAINDLKITLAEAFFKNLTIYKSRVLIGVSLEERIPIKYQDDPLIISTFHANMLLIQYTINVAKEQTNDKKHYLERLQFFFEQVFKVEVYLKDTLVTNRVFDKIYADYPFKCKAAIFTDLKPADNKIIEYIINTIKKEKASMALKEFMINCYEGYRLEFKQLIRKQNLADNQIKSQLSIIMPLFYTAIIVYFQSITRLQISDAASFQMQIFNSKTPDQSFGLVFFLSMLLNIRNFAPEHFLPLISVPKCKNYVEILDFFGKAIALEAVKNINKEIANDYENTLKYVLSQIVEKLPPNSDSVFSTTGFILIPFNLQNMSTNQLQALISNIFKVADNFFEDVCEVAFIEQYVTFCKKYGKPYRKNYFIQSLVPEIISKFQNYDISHLATQTLESYINFMTDFIANDVISENDKIIYYLTVNKWLDQRDNRQIYAIKASMVIIKCLNYLSYEIIVKISIALTNIDKKDLKSDILLDPLKCAINLVSEVLFCCDEMSEVNRMLVIKNVDMFFDEILTLAKTNQNLPIIQMAVLLLTSILSFSKNEQKIVYFLTMKNVFGISNHVLVKKWTILGQNPQFLNQNQMIKDCIINAFDEFISPRNSQFLTTKIILEICLFAGEILYQFSDDQKVTEKCLNILTHTYENNEELKMMRDYAIHLISSYKNSLPKIENNFEFDKLHLTVLCQDGKIKLTGMTNSVRNPLNFVKTDLFNFDLSHIENEVKFGERTPHCNLYYVCKDQKKFSDIEKNDWSVVSKHFFSFATSLGKLKKYEIEWTYFTHRINFSLVPCYVSKLEDKTEFDSVNMNGIRRKCGIFWIGNGRRVDFRNLIQKKKFDLVISISQINAELYFLSCHSSREQTTQIFDEITLRIECLPTIIRWIVDNYNVC
ncbi:hypothetical protein TVAG_076970 [Trichomonas vaginalis G3]|uniref:Uncharacterized protein n=1 Tax=Trichomonas vaginalis (strain ATCC PRA-98 / G3) TaxID=412133 RepID=A2D9U4_TRIV3|nr:armadillo (ARM) repeat-containing protein family [Trichomonas vaginalis G3]EAY22950.1 hypothetical protein TVAG_076970 [Trichomonas vaginalis G3]KAI5527298.1 armadillo (ARM) repeat-containing protein family [Trichomonas vaginalis G3]|eukprot:XP_001583936.1 hypothetical protein [Trichomonas vaginalis G3]